MKMKITASKLNKKTSLASSKVRETLHKMQAARVFICGDVQCGFPVEVPNLQPATKYADRNAGDETKKKER